MKEILINLLYISDVNAVLLPVDQTQSGFMWPLLVNSNYNFIMFGYWKIEKFVHVCAKDKMLVTYHCLVESLWFPVEKSNDYLISVVARQS